MHGIHLILFTGFQTRSNEAIRDLEQAVEELVSNALDAGLCGGGAVTHRSPCGSGVSYHPQRPRVLPIIPNDRRFLTNVE